jgi:hypothetical protein
MEYGVKEHSQRTVGGGQGGSRRAWKFKVSGSGVGALCSGVHGSLLAG